MARVIKSIKWTTASTACNIFFTMLQLSILTRFFETATFGEYAVLNLSIEIFSAVSLGGISTYLVHRKDISSRGRNTVFYLALTTGLISFLIVSALAHTILSLFSYSYLSIYLELLAVLLIIHAISAQYEAVAIISYEHSKLARVEITSRIIAFVVAMLTIEFQLMCLVIAAITHSLTKMLFLMLSFSEVSKLKFEFEKAEAKRAWRYGIYNIGSQFLNLIRRQVDILILAMTLNTSELGIYHVLRQLAARPGQSLQPIIRRVTMPLMSEVQNNSEKLRQLYYDTFVSFSFVMSFLYVPLIVFSSAITLLFFGDKYVSYHQILGLLSIFWFVRIVAPTTMGTLVQSTGHTHLTFYWNIAMLPMSVIVMYVSSLNGIYSLCIALIIFQLMLFFLANELITKKIIKTSFTILTKLLIVTFGPFLFANLIFAFIMFDNGNSWIQAFVELSVSGLMSVLIFSILYLRNVTIGASIRRLKKA